MSDVIAVTGNLTSAPQRRDLASGTSLVTFGLATSERRLHNGEWADVGTNYYNVSAFRGLAEHALLSLERGQRVIVIGKLTLRPWEANGRGGTRVDLEASSLGPDLRFGVTTFTKDSPVVTTPPTSHPQPAPDGEWSVPLAEEMTPF